MLKTVNQIQKMREDPDQSQGGAVEAGVQTRDQGKGEVGAGVEGHTAGEGGQGVEREREVGQEVGADAEDARAEVEIGLEIGIGVRKLWIINANHVCSSVNAYNQITFLFARRF